MLLKLKQWLRTDTRRKFACIMASCCITHIVIPLVLAPELIFPTVPPSIVKWKHYVLLHIFFFLTEPNTNIFSFTYVRVSKNNCPDSIKKSRKTFYRFFMLVSLIHCPFFVCLFYILMFKGVVWQASWGRWIFDYIVLFFLCIWCCPT